MSRRQFQYLNVLRLVHRLGIGKSADSHPFHELVYFIRGAYSVAVGREHWSARNGDVFFYPAHCPHASKPTQDLQTQSLIMNWRGGPRFAWMKHPFRIHDRHGRLLVALTWIHEHTRPRTLHRTQVDELLAQALFWEIAELLEQKVPGRNPVQQARRLLEVHSYYPWTMRELGGYVELAPSLLARRFKLALGLTPMKCLRQVRLRHALNLLQSTRLPLKAIAAQVGLQNRDHLCVLLKSAFGRTSRELRGQDCGTGFEGGRPSADAGPARRSEARPARRTRGVR